MLNLVNTLQSQVQTKQPAINTNDISRSNESKREQFDKIFAHEVADKKNAPTAEHTANPASNKTSEKTEVTQKQTDTAHTDNKSATTTENTDITASDEVSEKTESTQQTTDATSVDQTALLPQNQLNTNMKNPALGLGQSQNLVTTLLSSQPGSQQGIMQDFLDDIRSWHSLQTANPAGDGKILSFSTHTHKEILSGLNEPSALSQIDSDTTQHSGLNNLAQIFSPSSTQAAAPHSLSLDTQIGQPKWNGEFAQKIVWLVNQQNQVAELRLNPAHLGPVEIMLSLTSENGTQATAQFVSPHLAVREAIEASLPKLRELMAENGIQLGDVMVGAESFQRQQRDEQRPLYSTGNARIFGANDESDSHLDKGIVSNRHIGIVNTFA
ncbi:flagellar hook-length control protein FliK [Nitrosomonas aestuarii]|uniref:Flagellar hook-length control protein FliK n=1 Tax=Nitrosomonas aestuarii TaxID=52441 RepID=A0A1I4F8P8_9PROT|nr:flagellar hook-length control protein FliK [Nitrosomonas aestuarii]SFL12781.1 flagellar hook-length control protein FliK [Nitrosomonas aestuarii]